jgi:hypothetical protein
MHTVPATVPGQKAPRDANAAKGQRKGAGKGNGATSKNSMSAATNKRTGRNEWGMSNAPVSNGSGGSAASPGAPQIGFDRSLRANLEILQSIDSNRIVQVRKINRLGFESAQVLEEYFSRYGQVDYVLVSHCYAKARNLRFRPSGLGFVVMSAVVEVQKILADGPEMHIDREVEGSPTNITIQVQAFKPQKALEADLEEGGMEPSMDGALQ